jgi:copper chaperone NosL
MTELLHEFVGPRVPGSERRRHPGRYLLPTTLLSLAAICLVISIFLPYWEMTLHAPQYPGGLKMHAYLNRLTGDVREIDGLNHYIGMRPLGEAAQLERSLSLTAVGVIALLLLGAVFVHTRWAAYLSVPALLFPLLFLGDLYFWMRQFGQNLDPHAPRSSAIKPFVPPILGVGKVGQFHTVARVEAGYALALLASGLILAGLYFHRRAYKPLVEVERRSRTRATPTRDRDPQSEPIRVAGS